MDIKLFLEQERENIINDIKELVKFESIHGEKEKCTEALRFVLKRGEEMGFKTVMGKNEDVGIVEIGEGEEIFGLLTHVDVVEPGDLNNWTKSPFELHEKDGYLFGRGVVDDKGPTIMSLYALKYLAGLGKKFNQKVQLIVGTCEEGTWTDMESFKEEFPMPNKGFSPDGEFPIYNKEKGYLDIELHFEESNFDGITEIKGGSGANSVPAIVSYVKDGEEVVFNGLTAHASMPELGKNAINMMCRDFVDKFDLNFVKFINKYFPEGEYQSLLPVPEVEGPEGEDLGESTMVPTTIKKEGNVVTVNFNIRHKFGMKGADIIAVIESLGAEYNFTVTVPECMDPIFSSEKQDWIQSMAETYNENGYENEFKLNCGTSYAKSMDNFVCWGPVFPGETETAHMEDENIKTELVFLATKIYAEFLEKEVLA